MNRSFSSFIPLTIITLSLIFILAFQVQYSNESGANLTTQREAREKIVEQAKGMKAGLEKLVIGIIELTPDDADARAIVEKHQIRRNVDAPVEAAK
jgi:hypothetical protein